MWRTILLGLLWAWGALAAHDPEAGRPQVRNYSPRDYGSSPQNWGMVQTPDGVLYVANNSAVLTYDGVGWRRIPTPRGAKARSIDADADGNVFVGTEGDFGRLEADQTGRLVYRSLVDAVPAADRIFEDVWKTHITRDGVYFQSFSHLFRWRPDGVHIWRPSEGRQFHLSFRVGETVYIREEGRGLLAVDEDALRPIAGGERFADERVYVVLDAGPGRLLIGTLTDGLFVHEAGRLVRFAAPYTEWLREAQLYHGARLPDGRFALATRRAGVALFDAEGALESVVGRSAGVREDNVKFVYPDAEGSLWLSLANGLARVDIESTDTRFGEAEGLRGIVLDVARHDGRLYLATNVGLLELVPAESATQRPRLATVAGLQTQTWALHPTEDGLLVASSTGVHALDAEGLRRLTETRAFALHRAHDHPALIHVAERGGLGRLRLDPEEGWVAGEPVAGISGLTREIAEGADGELLLARLPTGVDRFVPGGAAVRLGADEGLLDDVTRFFPVSRPVAGSHLVAKNGDRLLVYRDRRFVDLGADAWGVPTQLGIQALAQDDAGQLWISAGNMGQPAVGVARPTDGGYAWDTQLTRSIPFAYAIHAERHRGRDLVWFAGEELVRLEQSPPRAPEGALTTLIRRVEAAGRADPLYAGAGTPVRQQLEYANNALRFEFAAPSFVDEATTRYRHRLRGFDDAWSPWGSETRKEYSNLPPGAFTFEAQARDPRGRLSSIAPYRFLVRPPWYRTWWAWLLYAVGLTAALYVVVRAWTWRLRERNRRLEAIVAARTAEIREKNAENERLLLNILPPPIAERLKRGERTIADTFDSVTVLFSDVVGFTTLSARISPTELVELLNDLFSELDRLAERHGVEKIKTIGDAYMAVAGLPEPSDDHAARAARMALDMIGVLGDFNARHDTDLNMRIGLHTGPVVAGVIGEHKFIYDLWGDTVNTASRMESHGAPGRVQVSAATRALLADVFECEDRGEIAVKGKGVMRTWWLVRSTA